MKTGFYYLKLFILSIVMCGASSGAFSQTATFNYTGGAQLWTVPPGVTSILVDAQGAVGGEDYTFGTPANGGRVQAVLAVTPGQVLNIYAGGAGGNATIAGGAGGYNGGGTAAVYFDDHSGGGGGGATDIRIGGTDLTSRVIVAGGAGGSGVNAEDLVGGAGGGLTGGTGATFDGTAATGGTQVAGGTGGVASGVPNGMDGAFGIGGDNNGTNVGDGGGGGGGYYGGGGGAWNAGGGGSSYTDPVLVTSVIHTLGYNPGSGFVIITIPNYAPTFANGSPQNATVCENGSEDVSSLLAVNDINSGDEETWSAVSEPLHGNLTGLPDSMISTGSTLTPSGITYIPGIGYSGNDTFSVQVSDGNGGTATTTVYVTVNPLPSPIGGTGTLCSGANVALSDGDTGGTWSSSNSSVASVDGSGILYAIAGGTATISYTGANGCSTTSGETVNTTPDVTPMDIPSVCNGSITGIIHFSGSVTDGVTYTWSNDNTAIGLVADGVDSIGSFIALNPSDTLVSATITVTPSTATCTGDAVPFTLTVKPTPSVDTVVGQVVCSAASTTEVDFTGSGVDATAYNWTSSNTSIGLDPGGSGSIPPFTAINETNGPVIDTITVTPVAEGCSGAAQNFTITVNRLPFVAASENQIVCNGLPTTTVIFTDTVAGTSFTWTNSDTSIGLVNAGIDSISSFIATNDSSYTVTSSIIVTPAANGCIGATNSFTIAVNPTPKLTSLTIDPVCDNAAINYIPESATTPISFSWSRDSIGGISNSAASGTDGFTEMLNNTTPNQIQVTYVYALNSNGCLDTQSVTVVVNPLPVLSSVAPSPVCDSALFTYVSTSLTPGTTYTWSRDVVPGIANAANSGSGIINERLVDTTNMPVVVTYVDTLTAYGCSDTQTINVTINPKPLLITSPTAPSVCDNTLFSYVSGSSVAGTTYTWSRAVVAGISNPAGSGVGDTISETLQNTSVDPVMVVYVDTLTAYGCFNTATVSVTVNPKPTLTSSLIPTGLCDSALFNYTPTSATTGTTFAWDRPFVLGIALDSANGTGNPDEHLYNTTNSNLDVTYLYTLSANGCSNTQNVVVAVHPTPTLSSSLTESVCSGSAFHYAPIDSGFVFGTTFVWTRAHVAGISPDTSRGAGVINETLTDSALVPLQTAYVFVLSANGCTHVQTLNVTVNPAPPVAEITTHSPSSVCSSTLFQNFGTSTPPPAGQEYSWSAENATIWATGTGGQYILVSFPTEGNAVITLNSNVTGIACRTNNTFAVSVSGSVSEKPEVIYYNGQFMCLQNGMDSYQWGFDDAHTLDSTIVDGEVNQSYFISAPDLTNRNYWVMTNHNGCMQKSYFNVPTGITNVNSGGLTDVKVYPNPASNVINVDVNTTVSGSIEVQVLNMLGQRLSSTQIIDHKAAINVAALPAGVYLIDCYREGMKIGAARFIKN